MKALIFSPLWRMTFLMTLLSLAFAACAPASSPTSTPLPPTASPTQTATATPTPSPTPTVTATATPSPEQIAESLDLPVKTVKFSINNDTLVDSTGNVWAVKEQGSWRSLYTLVPDWYGEGKGWEKKLDLQIPGKPREEKDMQDAFIDSTFSSIIDGRGVPFNGIGFYGAYLEKLTVRHVVLEEGANFYQGEFTFKMRLNGVVKLVTIKVNDKYQNLEEGSPVRQFDNQVPDFRIGQICRPDFLTREPKYSKVYIEEYIKTTRLGVNSVKGFGSNDFSIDDLKVRLFDPNNKNVVFEKDEVYMSAPLCN